LFLVVPVVIKLDSPGPVFFRQARIGRNGSRFEALKFRSIYSVLPQGTWEANPERNDRRVTRVGRILRRTSLDEMPRLIDVLRGDMSIVGPRPDSMHHYPVWRLYPELAALDLEREVVKPGIIWWAHIGGGRGGLETAEAVRQLIERDLEYIRNWSVFVDLRIIVRAVFSRYGAL
jgi:putative colanic acid biosynthesis UDP-glucose lipid carrier transferase